MEVHGLIASCTSNINFRTLDEKINAISKGSECKLIDDCLRELSIENSTENIRDCSRIQTTRLQSKSKLIDILDYRKIHTEESYKLIALFLMAQLQSKPDQVYNSPSCSSAEDDLTPGVELLFDFGVYDPFFSNYDGHKKTEMRKTHNIIMLGSNSINMLCDKIICIEMDQEVRQDLSDDPSTEYGPLMKDVYKSRMLYIGNTFYIDDAGDDTREDYSIPIKEWAQLSGDVSLGETLSMYDKTCLDLNARIGQMYLFQHLGYCEHVIQIEDVRLITKYDCLQRSQYPMRLNERKYVAKNCMFCTDAAKWIVTDNERMPASSCPMCHRCFLEFNYTENGQKIGEFKAKRIVPVPLV